MDELVTRKIDPPSRLALLAILDTPGAVLLEGWSDAGRLTITLPRADEIRALDWREIGRADSFLRPIIDTPGEDLGKFALPFAGGWVGFLAYEVGADWENSEPRSDAPCEPAAWFARHSAGFVTLPDGEAFAFGPESKLDALCALLDGGGDHRRGEASASPEVDDSMGDGAYQRAVEEIRGRISWGEVYQVNLTRRFAATTGLDPVDLYLAMTGDEPPRCSAFLRGSGWAIASASPEVFLRFDPATGRADSRPIKGTLRRTGDDEADEKALLASAKDEAEHLMIVDLVRNDLGKVAPAGGVSVPEYKAIRTLAHVVHLESIVEAGGLGEGELYSLVRALFPGGSITGAPKRAAVHAIREIEPCARGVYTGAIGFVDRRGFAELSVAIRTAVIGGGLCRYHAGGGIVWDSDPEAEDRESFAKSIGFLEALGVETT